MTDQPDISRYDAAVAGAAPAAGHLAAWPTLSRAAELIGRTPSV